MVAKNVAEVTSLVYNITNYSIFPAFSGNVAFCSIYAKLHLFLSQNIFCIEFLEYAESKNLWDFIVACIDYIINHTLKPTQFIKLKLFNAADHKAAINH